MYTVIVRFISSVDLWNATAMAGIAGKYMFAVRGWIKQVRTRRDKIMRHQKYKSP